jgi:predicted component of type VI protein secretion system
MSGDINLTLDKFQELWYKAIVSIGAASSTVENKELRALLEFTAHNGSALWSRQNCFRMSRVRFTQLKYESFCKIIKSTQLFTEFCREYY